MSGADRRRERRDGDERDDQGHCDMAVSVDGFTAGPNQSADKPFGDGPVDRLTAWMFEQREANAAEIEAIVAAGAFIMGRNMFGPGRGDVGRELDGLVGRRAALPRAGLRAHPPPAPARGDAGRHDVHFVTDGIESALAQAREAAGERRRLHRRRRPTVNQYLAAGRSTSCACTSCQWCSASASGCSTAWARSTSSASASGPPTSSRTSRIARARRAAG